MLKYLNEAKNKKFIRIKFPLKIKAMANVKSIKYVERIIYKKALLIPVWKLNDDWIVEENLKLSVKAKDTNKKVKKIVK